MTAYGDSECAGCDSFAHDPCFTHDAVMDICPHISGDLCEYSYHELAYLVGLDRPRYPVPALHRDVSMTMIDLLWCLHDAPIEWWIASKPNVKMGED